MRRCIIAYVSKNPKFDSTILKDIASGTPDNPAAGSDKLVNRNGSLFIRDDSGTEKEIGELPIDLTADVTDTLPVANGGTGVTSSTGTGAVVLNNSPSLTTPNIGTPSAGTLTNTTGLPIDGGTTGTLPLSRGGTGQTTATTAFDALSPTTTKGDLIVSDGTNNIREAVGADGLILKADSTTSTGLVWGSAAAGTGEVNYIENPDAEANTTGWATYADAAGSTPVDGTGGTANITFTRQDSVVLRGNQTFKITKDAANRQGEGVSYDFTIKGQDTSKKLKIQFDFKTDEDAAYAAGDLKVYIYDVTNATLITPVDTSIVSGQNIFQTSFNSTTSTSYRLIFHVATTNASAWDAYIDNVIVGPGMTSQGAAVGPVEVYDLQVSDFDNSAGLVFDPLSKINYQRIGDSLRLNFFVRFTANGTDSGGFAFNIGPWLASIGLTQAENYYGPYAAFVNGTGSKSGQANFQLTTGEVDFLSTTAAANILGTELGTSGGRIRDLSFDCMVKITEWAGKGIVPMLAEDNLSSGTVITPDWNDLTEGNASTNTLTYYRVGDRAIIQASIILGSTSSLGSNVGLNMPTGLTIDSTKVTGNQLVGTAWMFDVSGARYDGLVFVDGSNVTISLTGGGNGNVSSTQPFTWTTSDQLHVNFTVPIAEFSGSQNSLVGYSEASENNVGLVKKAKYLHVEKSTDTTGIVGSSAYNQVFDTVVTNTFDSGDYDNTTGIFTAPEAGVYIVNSATRIALDTGNLITSLTVDIRINGTVEFSKKASYSNSTTSRQTPNLTVPVSLSAGDTVRIRTTAGAGTWTAAGGSNATFMTITKIG